MSEKRTTNPEEEIDLDALLEMSSDQLLEKLTKKEEPATVEPKNIEAEVAEPEPISPEKVQIAIEQMPTAHRKNPDRVKSFMGKLAEVAKSKPFKMVVGTSMLIMLLGGVSLSYQPSRDNDNQTAAVQNDEQHQKITDRQQISPNILHASFGEMSDADRQELSSQTKILEEIKSLETDSLDKHEWFPEKDLILDDEYVHEGSELYFADILRIADQITKDHFENGYPSAEQAIKYKNTMKLLLGAKENWPQAVKFKIDGRGDKLSIKPVDWQEKINVKEQIDTTFLVIGGELESITTAMRAADQGREVTLLYSGSLGGLSSDTGGNMRYFDGVGEAPRTDVHKKLFREGLGMANDNLWSLPDGMDGKLLNYLQTQYPNIKLVQTESLNSLHVNKSENEGGIIQAITTQEGVMITPLRVIDTDPECRLAEKLGIPETIETPAIGYGMVFDVQGVNNQTFESLRNSEALSASRIMALAGVEKSCLSDPVVNRAYTELSMADTGASSNQYITWGYMAASRAYDFYMRCLEYKAQGEEKAALKDLNDQRRVSGFNIALRDGAATFNSLSYQIDRTIMQHDHSLTRDPEFANLRNIEIPNLQQFLRQVTGNQGLSVRMPEQFYVRQATGSFETNQPYTVSDFNGQAENESKIWMTYPMDLRDLNTGRIGSDRAIAKMPLTGKVRWHAKPSASETSVGNYYMVSRSSAPAEFVGSLRILQSLMGQGVAVVDKICDWASDKDWRESEEYGKSVGPRELATDDGVERNLGVVFTPQGNPVGIRTRTIGGIEIVLPS